MQVRPVSPATSALVPNLLGRWCREANVDRQAGGGEKVSGKEYERMRSELAKVKTERDILKKALVYFEADLK